VPALRYAASPVRYSSAYRKEYPHVRMPVRRTHLERLSPALNGISRADKRRSPFGQAPIGTAGGWRRFRSVRPPQAHRWINLRPQHSTPDGWGRLFCPRTPNSLLRIIPVAVTDTDADRFRKEAEKCRKQAESSVSEFGKDYWLRLAAGWIKLEERRSKF
jgi:hypothetical protein